MTHNCAYCGAPATYQNSTQFAGTHYYCTAHAIEQPDCDEFTYIINPDDVKTQIIPGKNHNDGSQAIELFHKPTAITVEGHARSQHRAKDLAWTELRRQLNKLMALAPSTFDQQLTKQKTQTVDLLKRALNSANQNMNQQYLLDKLQEEAAEVIQAVSKIRRFGPHNHHPDRTQTNLQELVGELEDFQAIVWALEEIKYLDPQPSTIATIKKFNTLISS